jgi:hypothetical protein
MRRRNLGYVGLLLLVVSVALFITASRETQYETGVSRLKGTVIAKELRPLRLGWIYGVTYRVTVQGKTLEREGDVLSRKAWDPIRIGDEVDVESIGVTAQETRLAAERAASGGAYRWIAIGVAIAGVACLVLRLKGGSAWSAAKPRP